MREVNKSKIVLMVQNANTIFCYYTLSARTLKEFSDQYGENALENSQPVLKVYHVNNGIVQELQTIFIDPFADNWYINLDRGDIDVFVKLGRYFSDEIFVCFATSNVVTTPRLLESQDRRAYYIDVSKKDIPTEKSIKKTLSNL